MSSDSEPLVLVTANGLYCPPGDFHIDPKETVATALITHADGDHLCQGSPRYILARPGAPIAKVRLGLG
jgi:putative mRNA 3-end processing factor